MTGDENQLAKMPVAMIDVLAAHQIKEGILIAMLKQQKDKKPYKVSTTLEESAIASLMNQSTNYLMANHESKPIGTLHPVHDILTIYKLIVLNDMKFFYFKIMNG